MKTKNEITLKSFEGLAKDSKNLNEFINKIREIKNVPYNISLEFKEKYGGNDCTMYEASERFYNKHYK